MGIWVSVKSSSRTSIPFGKFFIHPDCVSGVPLCNPHPFLPHNLQSLLLQTSWILSVNYVNCATDDSHDSDHSILLYPINCTEYSATDHTTPSLSFQNPYRSHLRASVATSFFSPNSPEIWQIIIIIIISIIRTLPAILYSTYLRFLSQVPKCVSGRDHPAIHCAIHSNTRYSRTIRETKPVPLLTLIGSASTSHLATQLSWSTISPSLSSCPMVGFFKSLCPVELPRSVASRYTQLLWSVRYYIMLLKCSDRALADRLDS